MMTKKTQALYEAQPEIARGYIDALLSNQGFWPEDDWEEHQRWEGTDEYSFTVESYQSITDDCAKFLELLATLDGALAAMDDIDFDELGYSFYMCRMHAGHEPDFGGEKIDEAVVAAAHEMGEAFAEVGWWRRISHSSSYVKTEAKGP